eukprot:Amastigsp_a4899_7.p3 type:complete len:149 gc:universal Amastigsp_a4899_7:1164-718(-)
MTRRQEKRHLRDVSTDGTGTHTCSSRSPVSSSAMLGTVCLPAATASTWLVRLQLTRGLFDSLLARRCTGMRRTSRVLRPSSWPMSRSPICMFLLTCSSMWCPLRRHFFAHGLVLLVARFLVSIRMSASRRSASRSATLTTSRARTRSS